MSAWEFDTYKSGRTEGWYQGSLTTFRDRILKNLVREVLQNSLDNPAQDDQEEPVRVEFEKLLLGKNQIPGITDLKRHLGNCVKASKRSAKDHRRDVENARDMAKQDKFPVLVIRDFETSGMSGGIPGPCEVDSAFHNYIKTEGESGGSQSRAGSHGLGKNAPLISSGIRAIFASTCWLDENNKHQTLMQGRCQLMTRFDSKLKEGEVYGSHGYWGASQFKPLTRIPKKYNWLSRDNQSGTTIAVIGWADERNWEKLVVGYAITSFFAAFLRGRLELKVGSFIVDKNTIKQFLEGRNDIKKSLISHDRENEDEWDLSCLLAECLNDDSEKVIEENFQCAGKIGNSKLRLICRENAPNKIALLRRDILITDYIPGFYKRAIGSLKDFVGVYECIDPVGSELLRRMEPPQHNELKTDLLPIDERRSGKTALKKLANKLKELVHKNAKIQTEGELPAQVTVEFFSDEAGDHADFGEDEDFDPQGNILIFPKPRAKPQPRRIPQDDELDEQEDEDYSDEDEGAGGAGGSGVQAEGTGRGGGGEGPGKGQGNGGSGNRSLVKDLKKNAIFISEERFIRTSTKGGRIKCKTKLKSGSSVEVVLVEVGADAESIITIDKYEKTSKKLGAKGIVCRANKEHKINVDFQLKQRLLGGLKIYVLSAKS